VSTSPSQSAERPSRFFFFFFFFFCCCNKFAVLPHLPPARRNATTMSLPIDDRELEVKNHTVNITGATWQPRPLRATTSSQLVCTLPAICSPKSPTLASVLFHPRRARRPRLDPKASLLPCSARPRHPCPWPCWGSHLRTTSKGQDPKVRSPKAR